MERRVTSMQELEDWVQRVKVMIEEFAVLEEVTIELGKGTLIAKCHDEEYHIDCDGDE